MKKNTIVLISLFVFSTTILSAQKWSYDIGLSYNRTIHSGAYDDIFSSTNSGVRILEPRNGIGLDASAYRTIKNKLDANVELGYILSGGTESKTAAVNSGNIYNSHYVYLALGASYKILPNLRANLSFVTNYNSNLVNTTDYNQWLLGAQFKAIYNFKRLGIGIRYIKFFTPELELNSFKGYHNILGLTATYKLK